MLSSLTIMYKVQMKQRVCILLGTLLATTILLLRNLYGYPRFEAFAPHDDAKLILDWTGFFGERMAAMSRDFFGACPALKRRCRLSSDRRDAERAAALIFHFADLNWTHLPSVRFPHQRYVFYSQESPSYTLVQSVGDFFNWTMTTSSASDIPWPYAKVEPLAWNISTHNSTMDPPTLTGKTKWVAWFVSNCRTWSERELYVQALAQYIPVDVYGACGSLTCPRTEARDCAKMVAANYRFYLALENSVCDDYVTEKFWSMALLNIVLVVLKRAVAVRSLPKESFIAVDDFESPQKLAEHLYEVGRSEEKYARYQRWKLMEQIVPEGRHPGVGMCLLCTMLWNASVPAKVYGDVHVWLNSVDHCDNGLVKRILHNIPRRPAGSLLTEPIKRDIYAHLPYGI